MIETRADIRKSPKIIKPNLWKFLSLNILWLVLGTIPIALALFNFLRYGLQVPFLDEFDLIPLIAKLHTGGFTLNDFWVQHNEHRIVIWRILALALAKVGGYSISKELWAGFGFAILTLVVAWRLVRLSVPRPWVKPVTVICCWLLFSLTQWENWMWGFQPSYFLVNLQVMLAVLMLSYRPIKLSNFIIACGLTISATFTFGTALPIWLAILAGMILNLRKWRWKYLLGWILVGLGTTAVYLYGYNFNPSKSPVLTNKTFFLGKLPETIVFILDYMGAMVATWGSNSDGAAWAGLVLIALTVTSVGWLWWRVQHQLTDYEVWAKAWPWIVIFLFGLFSAILTAISRVVWGVAAALVSRYTTVSLWSWLAGLILLGLAGYEWLKEIDRPALKKFVLSGTAAISLLGVVSFGFSCAWSLQDWQNTNRSINETRPFFYEYETAPTDPLGRVFMNDMPRIRNAAWLLSQYQEGPFRVTKEQYQQAQNSQWQNQLKDENFQAHLYPGNLMVMMQGNQASLRVKGDHIAFQHSDPDDSIILIDLPKFYQAAGLSNPSEPLMVELQMETAQYVRIFYDTGQDFNYDQRVTLATALEPAGQRFFRLKLPPDTKRFRVDASYRVSRLQQDSLKVIVYTTSH